MATRTTTSDMTFTIATTLLCLLLVPLALLYRWRSRQRRQNGFRFMDLPPEIRLQIFGHLIDDEQLTSEAQRTDVRRAALRRTDLRSKDTPSTFDSLRSFLTHPPPKLYTTLTRVSHQLREEFLDVFCQRAGFTFTLDASSTDNTGPFWNISSRVGSSMRIARIKILATPGLGNGFDPRVVTGNWHLKDRVSDALDAMPKLQDLQLSIQACGNQLWNPIWLWHYTSQSFKESKNTAFKRISFDLEGWNMREPNHLQRNESGAWEWRCSQDHHLLPDSEGSQPVRQFCGALYAECRVCDAGQGDE